MNIVFFPFLLQYIDIHASSGRSLSTIMHWKNPHKCLWPVDEEVFLPDFYPNSHCQRHIYTFTMSQLYQRKYLAKLPSFGVEGVEHQWFRSYLTGRIQFVTVDVHLSDPLPVSIGVPLGSMLGPLLFLLFLNDLSTIPQSCKTIMYADDTECESVSKQEDYKELESTINNDFYKVKEYFDTNKLSLNVPKCEFMLVGTLCPHIGKICNNISQSIY